MKDARVIFAGTPEFALASLAALVDAGTVPVTVLTQPDRPAGRGKKLTASPVKQFALAQDIPVLQPATLRDDAVVAELESLEPDLLVVAAYGLILPQNVLDIPAAGCVNVHASLLPRWRGAAPIQAAILAGDEKTGITLMAMTAGLDCGPVYDARDIEIGADETAGELHDRLAALGGEMLVASFDDILARRIVPDEQDEALATYAPKIDKTDAELDWSKDADALARRVRAYNPVPGAFFMVRTASSSDSLRIKCWRATVLDDVNAKPGTVTTCGTDGVVVACGRGALRLDEVQLPGKGHIRGRELANQLDLTGRVLI